MRTLSLLLLSCLLYTSQSARMKRQSGQVCSACNQRAKESPNMACCRCQDADAFCNNDVAAPLLPIEDFPVRGGSEEIFGSVSPGITCKEALQCDLFEDCDESSECSVGGQQGGRVPDLRQAGREGRCSRGQVLCCNPVPGDILETRAGLITSADPLGDAGESPDLPICRRPDLAAVINFNFGVSCGKRDSRVYHQARQSRSEGGAGEVTNPGEWPWAVLIFRGQTYVGAGVLLDNNLVATTATKVENYTSDPGALTVRLGDFDPMNEAPNSREDFPHVTMEVDCVRLHPRADYPITLQYNVAVLKLRRSSKFTAPVGPNKFTSPVSVVDIRSGPRRPANRPQGVEGWKRNPKKEEQYSTSGISVRQAGGREEFDLRAGLLADLNNEVDALGDPVGGDDVDNFLLRSYINTACLPERLEQFPAGTRCWVAAWGTGLKEQREISLPLMGARECERSLRPEFQSRGVNSWNLHASEICAGGEQGIDTCEGEGGAPLVCLDEDSDQYYAVGLVGYGFDCGKAIPAVYTNLADPDIKEFIEEAFDSNFC